MQNGLAGGLLTHKAKGQAFGNQVTRFKCSFVVGGAVCKTTELRFISFHSDLLAYFGRLKCYSTIFKIMVGIVPFLG